MKQETGADKGSDSGSGVESTVRSATECRLALLRVSYGEAFNDEGIPIARAAIEQAVARDLKLRAHPLANSDEAAGSFVPYRAARPEET